MENLEKLEKEAFVSGLEGTTISEIYLISVTLLSGYLVRCCCLVCSPSLSSLASTSLAAGFLLEYLTIIFPAVLILTVLADYTGYVLLAELFICIVLIAKKLGCAVGVSNSFQSVLAAQFPPRHPYLSVTRTFVNLFTAIAILAVDFTVYPRRLAKVETYGSGLMDVGVGAFLMAHGVTSPEAREAGGARRRGYLSLLGHTLRQVLPLLVFGALRLLSLKSTGYQEHVTEYGVHWNFFFTIVSVRVLSSILHPLLVCLPYGHGVVAVVTATLYQLLLQRYGLESYILLGPDGDGSRIGLISANREGIMSCVGYLALYTGWVQVGKWLFKPRRVLKEFLVLLVKLVLMFVCLWFATSWLQQQVQPISRRLVNLSYILWIFSYGIMVLATSLTFDLLVLVLTETTRVPRPPPYAPPKFCRGREVPLCVASAVDYNQLGFFVLANLLTGLVNISMDTLHASALSALIVLLAYMAVMLALFIALHKHQIKIKI